MKELQIKDGQSLLDVVIKQHGSLEAIFDVASLNGFSLSQDLLSGERIKIDESTVYSAGSFIKPTLVSAKKAESIVSDGQNLLDVVLQETGSMEGLFEMAALNDLLISEELAAGQALRRSSEIKPDLVQYFAIRKHRVNTGTSYVAPQDPGTPSEYFDYNFDFNLS